MKKFNSESERNEFKDLCTEVLPAIGNIEQILKKEGVTDGVSIRVGTDGYLSMDVYNSKWRMARYEKDKLFMSIQKKSVYRTANSLTRFLKIWSKYRWHLRICR